MADRGTESNAHRGARFDLAASARRLGHYRWLEMRLFEVLGGWVPTVAEPGIKLTLSTHSYKHAWHAELWHDRLVELGQSDPDRLTVPASTALPAVVTTLAELRSPEQTLEKLVGVYRVVLPRVISAYRFHLDVASAVSDAAIVRSLRFALRDDLEDWVEGEAAIESLVKAPRDAKRAAQHQQQLETLIVDAGGIFGPATLETLEPAVKTVTAERS